MQPVPDTGLLPVTQPAPARHARAAAHLLRQHLPWNAGSQDKQNAGQGGAVRHPWSAAFGLGQLGWQQRGNDGPQIVG